MTIRLTGMSSGLDTEAMIRDLMSAYKGQKKKKTSVETKYSWKMDAWKELNKKIQNFHTKALSNFRYSSTFTTKKTTVSDTTKASVTASGSAVVGSQSLAIKQLAQSGYLTGGKISSDSGNVKGSTKLSDLGYTGADTSFSVNGKKIELKADSTVNDVVDSLQKAGLNASFDSTNQRFFVNSKVSGKAGDFSITADSASGIEALKSLGLYTGITSDADKAEYKKWAEYDIDSAEVSDLIDTEAKKRAEQLMKSVNSANDAITAANKKKTDKENFLNGYTDDEGNVVEGAVSKLEANTAYQAIKGVPDEDDALSVRRKDIQDELKKEGLTDTEKTALNDELTQVNDAIALRKNIKSANDAIKAADDKIAANEKTIENAYQYIDVNGDEIGTKLHDQVKAEYEAKIAASKSVMNGEHDGDATAVKQNGQDAIIFLNGAEFTSNKNTFDINGLTITCTDTTALNESGKAKKAADPDAVLGADDYTSVMLSTDIDASGIYDKVKDFLKEYNDLIKEMETMYGADSAKKYDILDDDEKDAMSDKEVEAWEKKIKDSLLRRDDNIDRVMSTLKNGMAASYEINGKSYSLSSFGIETLSYFLAEDNEKGVYHIWGDPDDKDTSGEEDKLKAAILNDPEAVTGFFNKMANDLYTKMSTLSRSTSSRSFGNFYDDKLMDTQYKKYQKDVSDFETKLNKIEDKYYKQFTAMEKALSKLESSNTALASMMGMG